MQTSSRSAKLYVLLIAAAAVILFGESIRFDFVNYDDYDLIYENTSFLSDPSNILNAFTSHAFIGKRETSVYYRPVLQVSYIIDYRMWGLNPMGYHATNIGLHALAAIVLFYFLTILLQEKYSAFLISLLFAFHPIQVESVAWIAGRNDILLGLFIILMLYFYALHRLYEEKKNIYIWLSLFSFTLAIFTKESATFYILLLPLYDAVRLKPESQKLVSKNLLRNLLPFIIVLCGYLLLRNFLFGEFIGSEKLYGKLTLLTRLRLIPAMLTEHLSFLLFPVGLSVEHPLDKLIWLEYPWDIVSYVVTGVLPIGVFIAWKIKRSLSFGLLWLLVGFLPLLNVIPLAVPILEHRLYLPTAGFAIFIVVWIKFLTPQKYLKFAWAALIAILIVYAFTTFNRLPAWKNSETLWLDAIKKAPTAHRSYFNLAGYYYENQQPEKAIPLLKKYIDLRPDDFMGYSKLRQTYFILEQYDNAISICRQMIRMDPQGQNRYTDLGLFFEKLNMTDSAITFYRETLEKNPEFYKIHDRLGTLYFNLSSKDSAEYHYQSAIRISKEYSIAYFNLGMLYYSEGKKSMALSVIMEGMKYGVPPKSVESILNQLKFEKVIPNNSNEK
jgi:protein O-mannosyl-transferase